ncbi:TonB-dependent receptor [Microbulbifer sp. SAOS-129_SWC]|uniref:TonB-dependent receptor plug domain-containing protein n=1 Tax=Microbulbifer sp. SAOS-129_SWC TaxID=3145235 RepID=UPI003216EAF5
MDRSRLSRAIKSAIATAAISTSFATVSFAQQSQQVEEVVVTGSRIQRTTDATSATPISVFDAAALEKSGNTTLENFLQEIPSVTGGQLGSSVNNGNPGLATVSLRGLGASRTLVLVDGRRMVSAGTTTGTVDLNTIPTSIIERVEVLRDGASTIYGSDAIAGVINIITKKDFEGAEVNFYAGTSTHNDGQEYSASMTLGTGNDNGHVVVNAEYSKRTDVFQSERRFSECPLYESGDSVLCGGSPTTSPARFTRPDFDNGANNWIVDPDTGQVRIYDASTDSYNYAAASYLITPQEVFTMYGYGDYQIADFKDVTTLDAFGELTFANRRSDQLLAPEGTFWGPTIPANQPYNPVGEDVSIGRRITETGGRAFFQDVNTWRGVAGLKGEWCNGWTWDVSYNYARWVDPQIEKGRANQPRFDTLLGAVDSNGNPTSTPCADDAECPGLWNPFQNGTLNQAQIDYATVTNSPVEKSTLREVQANMSGDFGGYAMTSEPFKWAAGYEFRSESAEVTADGAAELGQIYFVTGNSWGGSYNVDEFYGEVRLPFMEGESWADTLAAEASFRYSDYDTIGSDTTWAAVLDYAPIEQVRFRGTWSQGFRAPGIDDLFSPQQLSAESYSDPCYNWTGSSNANIRANCQADGVNPTNSALASAQATGLFGGNPDLKAEQSTSWTIGIVWTPTFVEDLSATFDYYNIEVDDAIGTFTTNTLVSSCYESANFSSPNCALITGANAIGATPSRTSPRRQADGTVAGQLLTSQNISTFKTSGVDLGLNYSMDVWQGTVSVDAKATWLDEYKFRASNEEPEIDLAGFYGADPVTTAITGFPEWKGYIGADYKADNWSAGTILRWIGPVDDINPGDNDLATHADSTWYMDLHASYFCWENMTVSGGIRNAWNQQPPYVTNYDDMNTIPITYDTLGRFFYGTVSFSF